MIKGKGKNPIKQYLLTNEIHQAGKQDMGISLFWLCIQLYVFDLQVYLAMQGNSENGLTHRFVTDLCLPNLGANNHVVYMDNFFTAIPLIRQWENAGTYSVDTTHSNRSLCPDCLKHERLLNSMNRGNIILPHLDRWLLLFGVTQKWYLSYQMSTTHMVLEKFRERKGMALLFNYRDNLKILLQVSS